MLSLGFLGRFIAAPLLFTYSVAYALPVKDHAAATGVVPVLSGSAHVMGGGTYPRANFLKDGSILGSYALYANGNSTLTMTRSTDQGATWTVVGSAATKPTATADLDNAYPLQLPSGRILLAFRNHDVSGTKHTYFRITVCYSDDNGATWAYLSTPAESATIGLWEPFLRNAQDGSLQIYYSKELSGDDQNSIMQTSTDGGLNWSSPNTISGGNLTDARDGMLGVTTVSGSNLLAIFETRQNGLFTINSISSTDDGKTWGNRRRVYTPTGTNNNAGSPQVITVGSTLVASFMTDEDTQTHAWITGAAAKLVTSSNGGATWENKITFGDVQSNWPSLLTLDSSSFLAMVDHDGSKAQKIGL